jgi:hypothetical protein
MFCLKKKKVKSQRVKSIRSQNVKKMPTSAKASLRPTPVPISPKGYQTLDSPQKENLVTDEGDECSGVNLVQTSAQKVTITKIKLRDRYN